MNDRQDAEWDHKRDLLKHVPTLSEEFGRFLTDIKANVKEDCAKLATLQRILDPGSDFERGYNTAVSDIAARIRRL